LLVKYGYYANIDDINMLITPLMSLLNGKNDKPFPAANDEGSKLFRKARNSYLLSMPLIHISFVGRTI